MKNSEIVKWIVKNSKKGIFSVVLLSLLGLVTSVSYIGVALLTSDIIDIATSAKSGNFSLFCLFLLLFVLVLVFLGLLQSKLRLYAECELTESFRSSLFSKLLDKKYADITNFSSGEIINRFSADTATVINGVISLVPGTVTLLGKIVAGAVALFTINTAAAAVIIAVGVILPVFGRLLSRKYKKLQNLTMQSEDVFLSCLSEIFSNISVVKTFHSLNPVLKRTDELIDRNKNLRKKRGNLNIFMSFCVFAVFTLGYYILLIFGAWQIKAGVMTYGTLTALLQIVIQIRSPLKNISGIIPQYYQTLTCAKRLMEIELLPNEENADGKVFFSFEKLQAENLCFSYGREENIKNMSFAIKKNNIVAVIGPSGSGKTTLLKLILGLLEPSSGLITVNDRPINLSARKLFSYVPQGSMILSGTIRENLTLCRENITQYEIDLACRTAEIYDYIISLPFGFDTKLSEGGHGMSEGQLQRLAIARAILCDSPVLLLDESTSALDEATEERLLHNIKELKDKTVIFITHRKKCLEICDSVINTEKFKQ